MTRPLTSLLVLLSLGGAAANDVTQYFRSLPSRIPQCQVDGADGARRTIEHVICVYISPDGGIVQHKDIGRAPGSEGHSGAAPQATQRGRGVAREADDEILRLVRPSRLRVAILI